ncbi:hypothetical protein [Dyadobacter sp. LHD-138]|uniref:hypothetical protein n=1 Tax=Dyadobacter sp. LHD-138 TaxID=3071413 RepID=UPI0027E0CA4B|nr:hypothetical protein [Dyadobacter sp. LHD-138]MDQ6479990.1 hypothetical protein [Dyadobacter sp. LHD-138]
MELIELKDFFEMDFGAPLPMIVSTDTELFITFYSDQEIKSFYPNALNPVYSTGVVVLKFKHYLKYTFGIPGNETIEGHPYFKLGMKLFKFYELTNSDLVAHLEKIEKSHQYYNPNKWKDYKHYILTFHDNMFECVAKKFKVRIENLSIYDQANKLLSELSTKEQ